MSGPVVTGTRIPGLLHVELELHTDPRGWFKEGYQQAKLEAAGIPHLDVLQHNVSYNEAVGVTRGIHAEPWNKYVSPSYAAVLDTMQPAIGGAILVLIPLSFAIAIRLVRSPPLTGKS